jgi:hypothetical protein
MSELTQRVIADLDGAKDAESLSRPAWMASDLIRKSLSPGYNSGFVEIDRETVTDVERQQLRDALMNALARNDEPRFVAQTLDALTSCRDRSLLPLLIDYLTKYLQMLNAANGALYSVLVGLDAIDEPVFAGRLNRSAIEIERNRTSAQNYLHERGIDVPY